MRENEYESEDALGLSDRTGVDGSLLHIPNPIHLRKGQDWNETISISQSQEGRLQLQEDIQKGEREDLTSLLPLIPART